MKTEITDLLYDYLKFTVFPDIENVTGFEDKGTVILVNINLEGFRREENYPVELLNLIAFAYSKIKG